MDHEKWRLAEAARQARPLAVADVIRQGERRHRRAITAWSARAPGAATQARPGRRWPGWVAPLAAAAAVTALVPGAAAASGPIHGSRAAAGTNLAHRATAYAVNEGSGTVTAIRTATNTALPPIRTGRNAVTIVITP